MNPGLSLPDRLSLAFTNPSVGIHGLVGELLAVSCETHLRLTWSDDRCRVVFPGLTSTPELDLAYPRSRGRAVLARIAALCAERFPNTVSPYRGEGTLTTENEPNATLRVTFVNTPEIQTLNLIAVRAEKSGADSASVKADEFTGQIAARCEGTVRHAEAVGTHPLQ